MTYVMYLGFVASAMMAITGELLDHAFLFIGGTLSMAMFAFAFHLAIYNGWTQWPM